MNRFLRDRPYVSQSFLFLGKPQVDYIPFNKVWCEPVSAHNGMEFIVNHYRQVADCRPRLDDFYSRRELPVTWGPFDGSVQNESTDQFLSLIHELSKLDILDANRYNEPSLRRALRWPFTYPTDQFFKLAADRENIGPWSWKNFAMTCIIRSVNEMNLDKAVVSFHKKILAEVQLQGGRISEFPGRDLILEAASVQCMRLVNAYKADADKTPRHSRYYLAVKDYDENCLHNDRLSKWTQDTDDYVDMDYLSQALESEWTIDESETE
ncbi:nonstructural protein [Urucuri virus]|uniref:Nonstructural protein n=1 Tax=Urucuri virus TaxID=1926502 RepID=A0A1S5SHX6_9VIRU|nr:nonstructural protein [Urucuri virus]API68902.1 nonstructural protein [Urucuri virus]